MTSRMKMHPTPVARAEFERLLNERAHLANALRLVEISIITDRARGVEPVTPETLTIEQAMSFGRRIDRAKVELRHALDAWLGDGDTAARDIVIAAMNAEAK